MKLPKFIADNTVLKITSLNSVVIGVRLLISLAIQRILALAVGDVGIAKIGQIRNVMTMLVSISTLGVFNGVVKYLSEFKSEEKTLTKLFSTVFLFVIIGSLISGIILYFGADFFSNYLFKGSGYTFIFKILAVIIPFIAVNRVFNGVVNGLSDYKKYAKIDIIGYLLSTAVLLLGLHYYNLEGVIFAIAISPIIQLGVLLLIFGKTLKSYVNFKQIKPSFSFKNQLLAFTLMSFISTFLLNYIELDIRTLITDKINESEAGNWTAMTFISKNYMVFISGVLTLYVLPKFSEIHTKQAFKNEVLHIYKTVLPIFAVGMLLIYTFKNLVVTIIYPNFTGMAPLFKWQLLGDFVRLASIILAHQFLAKRLVKSFVITELFSLILFYGLSVIFIKYYETEGIVIAHFIRYIFYFIAVIIMVSIYYKKK
ncbi:O-antigen translocase [Winogradskyella immobilis]|uniref:O-antigen translocase n=1 Tax=Winogradskyella immobilis TaxID=2816852 RepID=A0ABS8ELX5_9FLAO|nr:O-antigen translocase [Winogradskyella immobilis]MCC1484095.1 O-antigen translocase [Winogradskyella immobilis]MCG0016187.1 O-antigen translocase [Winogradskyella immobilis]